MSDARVQQIIAGILALMIAGTVCALWAFGRPVPELAQSILGIVVGFFFGNVRTNGFGGTKNSPPKE